MCTRTLTHTLSFTVDDEQYEEIHELAKQLNESMATLIRTFCAEGMERIYESMESRGRDREAREYLAEYLVKNGLAEPHHVSSSVFLEGPAPTVWMWKIKRDLGEEAADKVAAKMIEIMGRTDELEAYLADDSE